MFKNIIPNNLYARTIALIFVPIFILIICVVCIFFFKHWEHTSSSLAKIISGQITYITKQIKTAKNEDEIKMAIDEAKEYFDLFVRIDQFQNIPKINSHIFIFPHALEKELYNRLEENFWFAIDRYPGYIEIRVEYENGYINFLVPRDRIYAQSGLIFILWLITLTGFISFIAYSFMRGQIRSIINLTNALEQLGRGDYYYHFSPSGAKEIRNAGHSFILMRERLKKFIDQRTIMLAAISHDIRTPLTRIRLGIELPIGAKEKKELKQDLLDVENMLDAYLSFSKGEESEQLENIEMEGYLHSIINEQKRLGNKIEVINIHDSICKIRKLSLKRALSNLLDNAFKHADNVFITTKKTRQDYFILIDDDGPGLDDQEKINTLKPFYMLDKSRNPNKKSFGLGLSIANDIIKSHGGTLQLQNSPKGGLRCNIKLSL